MISRQDMYVLLGDLESNGIDVESQFKKITESDEGLVEVVKFVNNVRGLDLCRFYENLRRNYNQKHSRLYANIVKEITGRKDVLTTLSALLTQILLYSEKTENPEMFLRHARSAEICKVLQDYFENYDLMPCQKLLRLIKADMKVLEGSKPSSTNNI